MTTWRTEDNREIEIREMTVPHLESAIAMLRRKNDQLHHTKRLLMFPSEQVQNKAVSDAIALNDQVIKAMEEEHRAKVGFNNRPEVFI